MNLELRGPTEHQPPPGRCCHWRFEDTWPKFDAITAVGRDGLTYTIAVIRPLPADWETMPLAVAQFFTPSTCPTCDGSLTCPECEREFVADETDAAPKDGA